MLKIQLVYRIRGKTEPIIKVITFPEVSSAGMNLMELLEEMNLSHIPVDEIVSLTIIGD